MEPERKRSNYQQQNEDFEPALKTFGQEDFETALKSFANTSAKFLKAGAGQKDARGGARDKKK